jgi:hypothetical protein
MLHVFSINRVKLIARKPEMTDKLRQREYCLLPDYLDRKAAVVRATTCLRLTGRGRPRSLYNVDEL